MIEENGHKWADADLNRRCVFCQMKRNYYLEIKRASRQQPKRQDLKEWMRCKKAVSAESEAKK